MAVLGNPEVIYLDEPTVGIDVITRRNMMFFIKNILSASTIAISTNKIEEAEYLCSYIAFV
jgi:ABC-2 type transport system ATP-binding protein